MVSFSVSRPFGPFPVNTMLRAGGSHDAFMMNQRITSETFRFKFLNYNRAWLINQLPSILTPRTLRRSRPYLINQFTRILNQLNQDISSDSEDDGRKFGPVALKANSRQIIRWWLAQARRRMRLREVVQPLISKARGTQCENCLSRRQLQVTCVIPLEVLAAQFDAENADQEFDQVRSPRFEVLRCLHFIQTRRLRERGSGVVSFPILSAFHTGGLEDLLDQVAAVSYYMYGLCC